MINIIKMGQVPNNPPDYRTTCHHCQTIFEHVSSDCYFELNYQGHYKELIKCPLCKTKVIPQKIKQPPNVSQPTGPLTQKPIYELTSDYNIVHQQMVRNCLKKN